MRHAALIKSVPSVRPHRIKNRFSKGRIAQAYVRAENHAIDVAGIKSGEVEREQAGSFVHPRTWAAKKAHTEFDPKTRGERQRKRRAIAKIRIDR